MNGPLASAFIHKPDSSVDPSLPSSSSQKLDQGVLCTNTKTANQEPEVKSHLVNKLNPKQATGFKHLMTSEIASDLFANLADKIHIAPASIKASAVPPIPLSLSTLSWASMADKSAPRATIDDILSTSFINLVDIYKRHSPRSRKDLLEKMVAKEIDEFKKQLYPALIDCIVQAVRKDIQERPKTSRYGFSSIFAIFRVSEELGFVRKVDIPKTRDNILFAENLFLNYLGLVPGARTMFEFLIEETGKELERLYDEEEFEILKELEGRTVTELFTYPVLGWKRGEDPKCYKELVLQSEAVKYHAFEIVLAFHNKLQSGLLDHNSDTFWQ